jgi:hypothetical protein
VFSHFDFNVASSSRVPPAQSASSNPRSWSIEQVGKWLASINMSKYIGTFAENEIDGECLAEGFDEVTLDLLGVRLPPHRSKLTRAIFSLFASR